jgi:hypothetical protein
MTPNFIEKLIKSYGDEGLRSSILKTIAEFKKEQNDIVRHDSFTFSHDDEDLDPEAIEYYHTPLCVRNGRPHLLQDINILTLYYKMAAFCARTLTYLHPRLIQRAIFRCGYMHHHLHQIPAISTIVRHLKINFKSKTFYFKLGLHIQSQHMPFAQPFTPPEFTALQHPNHKHHEKQYQFWDPGTDDKILVFNRGIQIPSGPVSAQYMIQDKLINWSSKYKLNGNKKDYTLIPIWTDVERPENLLPQKMKMKKWEIRVWEDDYKPTVSENIYILKVCF